MKFSEWNKELETLVSRSHKLLVDEEILGESAVIDEHTWKICLGDELIPLRDDKKVNDYDLKQAYSAREPGWQSILGGLKAKITLAENLHKKLAAVLVEPFIKEVVLDRLTGEDDIPDNDTIIRKCAHKRMAVLQKIIKNCRDWNGYTYQLVSPSEIYPLMIKYRHFGIEVEYGDLPSRNASIKNCWNLLNNFTEVETRVREFNTAIKPVLKLLARKEEEDE